MYLLLQEYFCSECLLYTNNKRSYKYLFRDNFFSYLTDFSYFPLIKIFRKLQDTHGQKR